jgi:hypothetical protein
MMAERGLSMAHATFMCWLQRYPPEIEKRWRQFAHHGGMDEIGDVLGRPRSAVLARDLVSSALCTRLRGRQGRLRPCRVPHLPVLMSSADDRGPFLS